MRLIAAAACLFSLALAAPAVAAVQTTGCASSTTCTLAELYAGGSIKVDDVTFNNFTFNGGTGLTLDPATVFLTGESASGSAGLLFGFSPDIVVLFDDFLGYEFNFGAAVDGASARRFNGATLSGATPDSLGIRGSALSEVDMGFSSTSILSIYESSALGSQTTDSLSLSNLATLAIAGALRLETDAAQSAAGIQSFRLALGLSGVQPEIPLPAAAPLFMAGLAGFSALRRRRARAA